MSDILQLGSAEAPPIAPEPPKNRARRALLKRLADVVSLPSSRVNTFERSVTADLLVEILRDAEFEERQRVARRLSSLVEIPDCLVRLILRDEIDIAQPLLTDASLSDSDLLDCVHNATGAHRRLIALRRGVSELVSEALVEAGETLVVETLLRNDQARLSPAAVEMVVAMTQTQSSLAPLLLRRPEVRPNHAYVLFWWADTDCRRQILQRFAVSREVLQETAGDVFSLAAEENWQDDLTRKALQFIERRQRNRAAMEKSLYGSLEEAIKAAAEPSMTREIAEEIAYLAGIKPMTGAKIMTDDGGEGLAVLCKATGLPRSSLRTLWRALRRPELTEAGEYVPQLARVIEIFDMIAVDRAQTVLRYWNWSLSSAMTPALMKAIRDDDDATVDEFSVPQRTAMLALGADVRR